MHKHSGRGRKKKMFKREYTTKDVPYKTFHVSVFMLYSTYGINCGNNDYETKFRVHYTLGGKPYVILKNKRLYI